MKHRILKKLITMTLIVIPCSSAHAVVPVIDPALIANVVITNGLLTTANGLLGTTNGLIGTSNTQLELIYQGLTGSDASVNIHADLANIATRVDTMSTSLGSAIGGLQKSMDYYRKKEILAKEDIQRLPGTLETNCQAVGAAATMANSSRENSTTTKAKVKLAQTYAEARRKTMRDPKADKSIQVAEHALKFCSETDAKAGLCESANICQEGDASCKANADQSASLFMSDGYESKAHEEGARSFITHIVNPYPSARPKASTVKSLGDASAYKYDAIVGESRMSISEAVMTDLWSDRANIFNDKAVQEYLNNIASDDNQTFESAKYYTGIKFNPASKPSFLETVMQNSVWFLNFLPGVKIEGKLAIASDNEAPEGSISRLQFYDMQVNSMYGNTSFLKQLGYGDGRAFQALGSAIALNNKLNFEMMKRMDKLILLSAAANTSGAETAKNAGKQVEAR